MEIYPTEARYFDEACWNYLTIGDDDDSIRRDPSKKLVGFIRSDFGRLVDRNSGGDGRFLDRRRSNQLATATRPVWLSYDTFDLESRIGDQLLQGRDRESRSAAEYEAQRHSAPTSRRLF